MAGGALIGALRVTLGLDTAAFEAGAGRMARQTKNMQKDIAATGASITRSGVLMTAGITAPFSALIASAIPAAVESQQAIAQVNAALASMGPVAGRSAEQLQRLAGVLQDTSNFDDDDVLKSVTANMLTFGKVTGDTFDRAQTAAVNLSARLGQDLQSSAIQVGKALNDPIKGVTALQRVGVSFTASQKEQIKAMAEAGNVAGAQSIILGELEKQFGGAAAAQRAATPTAATNQAWRTFQETVGGLALNVLPPLTNVLTTVLNGFNALSPGTQTVVIGVAAIGAAIGPVLIGLGGLVSLFGTVLPLALKLGPAFQAIGTAFTFVRALAVSALLPALLPILPVLAALAGGAALVYAAWKHWDDIKAVFQRVAGFAGTVQRAFSDMSAKALQGVIALATGVKTWLQDKLGSVFNWLHDKLGWVADRFKWLDDVVVRHSYIPDMVNSIGEHIARLDGVMVKPIQSATAKSADAFKALQERLNGILDRLFPEQAEIARLTAQLADIDRAMADKIGDPAVWAEARRRIVAEMDKVKSDMQAAMPQEIGGEGFDSGWLEAATTAANDNADAQKKSTGEIIQSYAQMAQQVSGSLQGLVSAIKGGDILDIIGKLAETIGSILGQIGGGSGGGGGDIGSLINNVVGIFGGARAAGGPVDFGKSYLVGERGPELFMPAASGTIVPNSAFARRSGGVSLTIHNDFRGADPSTVAAINARVDRMQRELPGAIIAVSRDGRDRGIL